jgi:hypothetical protein
MDDDDLNQLTMEVLEEFPDECPYCIRQRLEVFHGLMLFENPMTGRRAITFLDQIDPLTGEVKPIVCN